MTEALGFVNDGSPTVVSDAAAREAALAQRPEAERARIGESLAGAFSPARRPAQLAIIEAAVRFLRDDCEQTRGRKIASVGFCLGGALSALLACRDPELGGAVIFYGDAPAADEIPKIACPVLGLYGARDQHITS